MRIGIIGLEYVGIPLAIENAKRDLNNSFMNELFLIFEKMEIDTLDIIKTAKTKWDILKFYPGLGGDYCISVDPYYFTYKAQSLGYHPEGIFNDR